MARSSGPRFRRARHCAASNNSAVESGPPDTASTTAGADARSEKRMLASAAVSGAASSAALAADTLLFRGHRLLHVGGRVGIFAADLAPSGAGGFLLAQRGERLAEP